MATWVVTGANRGIGLEFAKQLLAEGHSVIAGVRSPESMKFSHEKMSTFQLDVSSTSSVHEFAENVKSMSQSIDILVNNAGRMDGRWQSLEDVDPEVSLEVLNVNTIGPLRVSQVLWPLLQASNQGKIANISSLALFGGLHLDLGLCCAWSGKKHYIGRNYKTLSDTV